MKFAKKLAKSKTHMKAVMIAIALVFAISVSAIGYDLLSDEGDSYSPTDSATDIEQVENDVGEAPDDSHTVEDDEFPGYETDHDSHDLMTPEEDFDEEGYPDVDHPDTQGDEFLDYETDYDVQDPMMPDEDFDEDGNPVVEHPEWLFDSVELLMGFGQGSTPTLTIVPPNSIEIGSNQTNLFQQTTTWYKMPSGALDFLNVRFYARSTVTGKLPIIVDFDHFDQQSGWDSRIVDMQQQIVRIEVFFPPADYSTTLNLDLVEPAIFTVDVTLNGAEVSYYDRLLFGTSPAVGIYPTVWGVAVPSVLDGMFYFPRNSGKAMFFSEGTPISNVTIYPNEHMFHVETYWGSGWTANQHAEIVTFIGGSQNPGVVTITVHLEVDGGPTPPPPGNGGTPPGNGTPTPPAGGNGTPSTPAARNAGSRRTPTPAANVISLPGTPGAAAVSARITWDRATIMLPERVVTEIIAGATGEVVFNLSARELVSRIMMSRRALDRFSNAGLGVRIITSEGYVAISPQIARQIVEWAPSSHFSIVFEEGRIVVASGLERLEILSRLDID